MVSHFKTVLKESQICSEELYLPETYFFIPAGPHNLCLLTLQVITIGRHVKGYHYIIANLVSLHHFYISSSSVWT